MSRAFTVLALATMLHLGPLARAWAAPKTIAIVNLSKDESAADLAKQARELLTHSEGLRPTTPGDLARALEDTLPVGGPDALAIANARQALAESMRAFIGFKSRQARTDLERARRSLFGLSPSATTSELLADVSFHMALIHLREENLGLAMGELQLLHRLDEREAIDPVRYPPDVVRAFKQARKNARGKKTASVSISATYDGAPVFVDGVASGKSPITIALSAGAHVIAIAAPQYQAAAILIDIDPGASQSHRINLEPRSQVVRAHELRFEAQVSGLDEEALRGAAARVSRLVGSDAVLLIVDSKQPKGAPMATLYIQHLDRLTYRHPVDRKLKRMLGLVTDVARPTLVDGVSNNIGPVPWYKKPWALAAIGGGTALTIVGLLSLGTGDETSPPRKGGPSFEFPEP